MKTKSRSASKRQYNWWKIVTLSLVVLASVYFIWQFMFIKNSQKSEAAGCSTNKQQCNTKRCCLGFEEKWKNNLCTCKEQNLVGKCGIYGYACNSKLKCCESEGLKCSSGKCVYKCVGINEGCNEFIPCCNPYKCNNQTGKCYSPKPPKPTAQPKPTVGQCGGTCVSSDAFCTGNDGRVVSGSCAGSKVCCEFD